MNKKFVSKMGLIASLFAPLLAAVPLVALADFSVSVQPLPSRFAANIPPTSWDVLPADTTAEKLLVRWGARSGWKVLWRGADEIPMKGQGTLVFPDFLSAADHVMKMAKADGFKVKAVAHSNNVLVITKGE